MIKKPRLQNLNKPITFTYYSEKQTTKGAKFPLQLFGGLDHIILKRCYRTINFWNAKLAPKGCNFFIECGYAIPHPANLNQTYQPHHANGNRTRKLSINMMIYTPQHGSVKLTSQYLIGITVAWQHPVHPKLQYDPNKQLTKQLALREQNQKVPQKLFLSQTDRMTERTRITICSLVRMLM